MYFLETYNFTFLTQLIWFSEYFDLVKFYLFMRLVKLDLKLKHRLVQGVVEFWWMSKVNVLGFFFPFCCTEDAHHKYLVLIVTGSC